MDTTTTTQIALEHSINLWDYVPEIAVSIGIGSAAIAAGRVLGTSAASAADDRIKRLWAACKAANDRF